jgi:Holliday junction resolvase
MGGSKLGLDVKYQQAKSAAFEFQEVLEDKVEIARLDQYLADADVSPFSRYVATLLEADEIYITTAIIKSRVFVLEAKKSDGIELELSVADLQQLVGTNVEVGTHNSIASKVTYKGAIPLVFGFQAVRVYYDDGRYTAFKPMNAGMAAMRSPGSGSGAGADWLVTESPFVRLVTD